MQRADDLQIQVAELIKKIEKASLVNKIYHNDDSRDFAEYCGFLVSSQGERLIDSRRCPFQDFSMHYWNFNKKTSEETKKILLLLNNKKAFGDFIYFSLNTLQNIKLLFDEWSITEISECAQALILSAIWNGDVSSLKKLLSITKFDLKILNQNKSIFCVMFLSSRITEEILQILIDQGMLGNYVDCFNGGILSGIVDIKRPFLKLGLLAGANPLHKFWANRNARFDQYSIIDAILHDYYRCDSCVEDILAVIQFGGGLLEKSHRVINDPRLSNISNILGKVASTCASMDLGLDKINLQQAFFENEIVFFGHSRSQNKRVWIFTLKELDAAIKGKNKDIIIPEINRIARSVLEANDEHLPKGLKQVFDHFQKELGRTSKYRIIL